MIILLYPLNLNWPWPRMRSETWNMTYQQKKDLFGSSNRIRVGGEKPDGESEKSFFVAISLWKPIHSPTWCIHLPTWCNSYCKSHQWIIETFETTTLEVFLSGLFWPTCPKSFSWGARRLDTDVEPVAYHALPSEVASWVASDWWQRNPWMRRSSKD